MRYHVSSYLAERRFEELTADVGFGAPLSVAPERLRRSDLLGFAGIEAAEVPTLPLEPHAAGRSTPTRAATPAAAPAPASRTSSTWSRSRRSSRSRPAACGARCMPRSPRARSNSFPARCRRLPRSGAPDTAGWRPRPGSPQSCPPGTSRRGPSSIRSSVGRSPTMPGGTRPGGRGRRRLAARLTPSLPFAALSTVPGDDMPAPDLRSVLALRSWRRGRRWPGRSARSVPPQPRGDAGTAGARGAWPSAQGGSTSTARPSVAVAVSSSSPAYASTASAHR